jgi:hypothetical protein
VLLVVVVFAACGKYPAQLTNPALPRCSVSRPVSHSLTHSRLSLVLVFLSRMCLLVAVVLAAVAVVVLRLFVVSAWCFACLLGLVACLLCRFVGRQRNPGC